MTSIYLPNQHSWQTSRADMQQPMGMYDSNHWWGGALASTNNGAERLQWPNYWPNQYYSSQSRDVSGSRVMGDAGGNSFLGYSQFPPTYSLTSSAIGTGRDSISSSEMQASSCQFYRAPDEPVHSACSRPSQVHHLSTSDGCPSPVADRGYFKTAADSCGMAMTSSPVTSRKKRRPYSRYQLIMLEKAFIDNTYITRQIRWELSCKLSLSERQVKVWFQNRRMKCKRIESRAPSLVRPSNQ